MLLENSVEKHNMNFVKNQMLTDMFKNKAR